MRVLVLGAAVSGVAAARLAARLGYQVTVYDRNAGALGPLLAEGIATVSGSWFGDLLDGVDLVVTSPGFPERSQPIVETLERRLPLVSEVEFAWSRLERPTVAITGTNGKTTVTSLISEMLVASGVRAKALGNIGTPLSDAVLDPPDVAVVEVSSFQLRFIDRFRPDVAVIINVAPDHLDWHGSFDAYWAAKARIVENQTPDDVVIFDADDEHATRIAARAPGPARRHASSGSSDATVTPSHLVLPGLSIPLESLGVDDQAFRTDLALAGLAAIEMGASTAAVESVAVGFRPGTHRRTVVGSINGVTFVDDSKATNPHAAIAAIRSYRSVVLIAGGLAKELDVAPLAGEPNVRAVIGIGTAGPTLIEAAGDRGRMAHSMEEAVGLAAEVAEAGDTVLLAPGCASFDMFDDYAHRGDAFSEAVATIIGARV